MMSKETGKDKVIQAIEDFGGFIKNYRLQNGLSLYDMAEIFACSPSYVWRIENYKRSPEMSTRLKMLISIWPIEDIHKYLEEVVRREKISK